MILISLNSELSDLIASDEGSSRPWGPQTEWIAWSVPEWSTDTWGVHLKDYIQWDSIEEVAPICSKEGRDKACLFIYYYWRSLLIPREQHYHHVDYGQYIRGAKYMIHIVQPSLKMDAWRAEHCSFFATGGRDEPRLVRWMWQQHMEGVIWPTNCKQYHYINYLLCDCVHHVFIV